MRKYKDFILILFTIFFIMLFNIILAMVNPLSYPNITAFYKMGLFWSGFVLLLILTGVLGIIIFREAKKDEDVLVKLSKNTEDLSKIIILNHKLDKVDKLDHLVKILEGYNGNPKRKR